MKTSEIKLKVFLTNVLAYYFHFKEVFHRIVLSFLTLFLKVFYKMSFVCNINIYGLITVYEDSNSLMNKLSCARFVYQLIRRDHVICEAWPHGNLIDRESGNTRGCRLCSILNVLLFLEVNLLKVKASETLMMNSSF